MDIVMTITTKLLVTLTVGIAALVVILTGTNIALNVIANRARRQLPPPQLQPPLQQQLVKTKRKRRNVKSGRRRVNAATMLLL